MPVLLRDHTHRHLNHESKFNKLAKNKENHVNTILMNETETIILPYSNY